jgi:hypothetical protein
MARGGTFLSGPGTGGDLLLLGAVALGGYYAYTQGWLSFLGIGTPAAAAVAPVAALPAAAPAAQSPVVIPSTPDQAQAAQATADQAAQQQIDLVNSMLRVRRDVGGTVPIVPVDIPQRQTGRVSTIGSGVSGWGIGTYRLRGGL